jgi:hypothetical protein
VGWAEDGREDLDFEKSVLMGCPGVFVHQWPCRISVSQISESIESNQDGFKTLSQKRRSYIGHLLLLAGQCSRVACLRATCPCIRSFIRPCPRTRVELAPKIPVPYLPDLSQNTIFFLSPFHSTRPSSLAFHNTRCKAPGQEHPKIRK